MYSEKDRKRIRDMYDQGISYRLIGEAVGCSKDTVLREVKKLKRERADAAIVKRTT